MHREVRASIRFRLVSDWVGVFILHVASGEASPGPQAEFGSLFFLRVPGTNSCVEEWRAGNTSEKSDAPPYPTGSTWLVFGI